MTRVAFVGPCGAGKSTITRYLRERGLDARMPAQEHSGVPDMWRQMVAPDYLVLLDAPNEVLRTRRPGVGLTDTLLGNQRERLRHAREHADLVIETGDLSVEAVRATVLDWLAAQGVQIP